MVFPPTDNVTTIANVSTKNVSLCSLISLVKMSYRHYVFLKCILLQMLPFTGAWHSLHGMRKIRAV